jgi:hypothetical protein
MRINHVNADKEEYMSSELPTNQDVDPQKPKQSRGSIWFPIVLIVLGLILLGQQIGDFSFDNWWALFILIPALSAFGSAFGIWQRVGRFTFAVWSTFYGGLFPLLVALIFLFNLDWEDYWPLFIILAGFGMMISGLPFKRPKDEKIPGALLLHRPWMIFLGLSGTLLGITFLGFNLDVIQSFPIIDFENWWGIFIIIPALGGLITAFLLLMGRHSILLVVLNLAASALITFTGIVAIYSLDWNLLRMVGPTILILVGIWLIVSFGFRKGQDQ